MSQYEEAARQEFLDRWEDFEPAPKRHSEWPRFCGGLLLGMGAEEATYGPRLQGAIWFSLGVLILWGRHEMRRHA